MNADVERRSLWLYGFHGLLFLAFGLAARDAAIHAIPPVGAATAALAIVGIVAGYRELDAAGGPRANPLERFASIGSPAILALVWAILMLNQL